MGVETAIVGAALTVGGFREQRKEAKIAAEAGREQAAQQRASNVAEAARSRRANLRKQRVQQAQIEAVTAAQGSSGSSAPVAISGNISQNAAANIAQTSQRVLTIGNQATQQQIIADANERAQTFAAIAGLGTTLFGIGASGISAGSKGGAA